MPFGIKIEGSAKKTRNERTRDANARSDQASLWIGTRREHLGNDADYEPDEECPEEVHSEREGSGSVGAGKDGFWRMKKLFLMIGPPLSYPSDQRTRVNLKTELRSPTGEDVNTTVPENSSSRCLRADFRNMISPSSSGPASWLSQVLTSGGHDGVGTHDMDSSFARLSFRP